MNYEDMSDFEINKLVVDKHLRMFVNGGKSRGRLDSDVWVFDSEGLPRNTNYNPCNNPSDAWPVIEIVWERLMQVDAYYQAHTRWDAYCIEYGVGKLRAAMICFLKMKDAENEK